jgi:hypothetical protein
MLSMKSRMSRPSSRKASAIVRPLSPTRSRLPGGSFIWPNTIATLDSSRLSSLMTSASIISW